MPRRSGAAGATNAPAAFGERDDDDAAAAPEPSSEKPSKRLKRADGAAVSVTPGVAEVLDQLLTADAAGGAAWLERQGLTSVCQLAELRGGGHAVA